MHTLNRRSLLAFAVCYTPLRNLSLCRNTRLHGPSCVAKMIVTFKKKPAVNCKVSIIATYWSSAGSLPGCMCRCQRPNMLQKWRAVHTSRPIAESTCRSSARNVLRAFCPVSS